MDNLNYQYKKSDVNYKSKYLKYKKKYNNLKKQSGGSQPPVSICNGKKDGISGCRTCCKFHFKNPNDYGKCVDLCMDS